MDKTEYLILQVKIAKRFLNVGIVNIQVVVGLNKENQFENKLEIK